MVLVAITCAAASAQDDFYRGKTIRIVVGYSAGGGFDTYSRAIARHLAKHIPGKPAVIVENMPGAAGLVAANSIYRAGRPDGLTIVNFQGTQVMSQILGRDGVEFDARKYEWLGAPTRENAVCALTRASGVTTVQQWAASTTPVKLGSVAPGGATHDVPRVLQAALGLPIHLVRGYKGTAEIRLAAQSGEVSGGCWPWESLRPTWRQALEAGEATVVLQVTDKPLPDLPGVPLALGLAKTDEARQLIRSGIIVPTTVSRVYAMPPATPADRVRLLRTAFLKTLADPEFVADARQAQLDIDPISGEEVTRLIGELFKMSPAVLAKLKELLR
ncbi:MAG TPA: tripartite tricarboxylate transporter substrate-binding protein [Solirubrobacterales bacterium]|nr:tripartite tricarboxylate transporter substrate-binding protein [Solirubrobacterales bacterium]